MKMAQLVPRFNAEKHALARPQLISVQYLRAIAALTVLVTHVLQWPLGEMQNVLISTGRLGVEIFFVLSGFIITIIGGAGRFEPFAFARNRVGRIVPIYWLATFLVVGLATAMPSKFRTTVPTLEGIVKSLLFIPSDVPKAPLLTLGWTLDFEMLFYLVFGSLFFVKSGARAAIITVLFTTLMISGRIMTDQSHIQAFYTSLSLLGFVVGVAVGLCYQLGWLQRTSWAASGILMFAGALSLGVFYYVTLYLDQERYLHLDQERCLPLFHASMSFGAMTIVFSLLRLESHGRLPTIPALHFLGDASYSLYLFHVFAVSAVWAFASKFFAPLSWASYLFFTVATIMAGLLIGILAYWYLERPILNWTRRRRRLVPVREAVS
jgi:exopolysaccharide production protein ExoZ